MATQGLMLIRLLCLGLGEGQRILIMFRQNPASH
jgi:hypothetical protein